MVEVVLFSILIVDCVGAGDPQPFNNITQIDKNSSKVDEILSGFCG